MKYESHITQSVCSAQSIYRVLSNLKNFERVRDRIPQDKIQELEIEEDYVRVKVNGLGQKLGIFIADKEEAKVVKYGVENSPIAVTMWIQMKEVAPQDTRIKLTVEADIPFMFRMMIEKKLQDGLNQAADMLAQFPYDEWEKGEMA
jgi:carbon monoxide dehydrogenase subunit G